MSEDRSNLPPSASELPRIAACPGYLNLKRAIGPRQERESEDAMSGTRCHAAYAGEHPMLSDDEQNSVVKAIRITDKLVESLGFEGIPPISEVRLFIDNIFTGKPDRVYIKDTKAIIPDAKFGRIEVEGAESNLQLRGYVTLLAWAHPELKEIFTVPVQPWVTDNPVPALYGQNEIKQAITQVMDILAAAKKPNAPRVAGSHCNYCPCMADCEEARSYALTPPMADMPPEITPAAVAATLTGPTLAHFLDRSSMAKKIIEACEDEAKRRLSEGEAVDGWSLKPGAIMQEITKPEVLFARASALGVAQEEFMEAVKVQKGVLKDVIKRATAKKGKELDEQMEELLAGCTEAKQKAPSLTKIKSC